MGAHGMSLKLAVAIEAADQWFEPAETAIRAALLPHDRLVELPDRATQPDSYREMIATVDIVVGIPKPEWLGDSSANLLILPSAGFDAYIGRGLGRRPGFTLTNGRGVFTPGLAEHVLWMMLTGARQGCQWLRQQANREWVRSKAGFGELCGATVCIVGLGHAGTALAERCAALGMRVIGVRRNARELVPGVERVVDASALDEMLPQTDHLVILLPGGQETAGMIDARRLALLKPHAWVYNVGRGSVLDLAALTTALQTGRLAGAGLDVFDREPLPADSPLWTLPNVIVTPHVAGFCGRDRERFAELAVDNLQRYRTGQPLRNVVDSRQLDP